jgi:hypothetical protein
MVLLIHRVEVLKPQSTVVNKAIAFVDLSRVPLRSVIRLG